MERLTKINGMGSPEMIACFGCNSKIAGGRNENCGMCVRWEELVNRAHAYENTELSPDDIPALVAEIERLRAELDAAHNAAQIYKRKYEAALESNDPLMSEGFW